MIPFHLNSYKSRQYCILVKNFFIYSLWDSKFSFSHFFSGRIWFGSGNGMDGHTYLLLRGREKKEGALGIERPPMELS
jgi:hypothetical protein